MRADPGDFDPRDSMQPAGGCLPPALVLGVMAAVTVIIAVGLLLC